MDMQWGPATSSSNISYGPFPKGGRGRTQIFRTWYHITFNLNTRYRVTSKIEHGSSACTVDTLMCLSIGTPKAINFPFVSNEKLMFLAVPVFKHITMRL